MDFLTDSSIMHRGGGWNITWLLVSLLYLGVSIVLWWVYYFYFKDRRRIGQSNDDKDSGNLVLGQTFTFIIFAVIAALLFFTGYYTDPWPRKVLIPFCWASIGVQLGLVLSMATPDDWDKLKKEGKDKL